MILEQCCHSHLYYLETARCKLVADQGKSFYQFVITVELYQETFLSVSAIIKNKLYLI